MLHPIGVYRNCPSNNIFIASGWLNATLGNHPRDPTIVSTLPAPLLSQSPGNPLSTALSFNPFPLPPFIPFPLPPTPQCAVHPHANRLSNNYRKYTRGRLAALFFPPPFCPLPRGHTINSLSFADMPLEI